MSMAIKTKKIKAKAGTSKIVYQKYLSQYGVEKYLSDYITKIKRDKVKLQRKDLTRPQVKKFCEVDSENLFDFNDFILDQRDIAQMGNDVSQTDNKRPCFTPFYHLINFKKIMYFEYEKDYNLYNYRQYERCEYKNNESYKKQKDQVLQLLKRSDALSELADLQQYSESWLNQKSFVIGQVNDKTQVKIEVIESDTSVLSLCQKNHAISEKKDTRFIGCMEESEKQSVLKNFAFFCLDYRFTENHSVSNLVGFSHNKLFSDFVGLKYIHQDGVMEGFEALGLLYSDKWINLYKKMLNLLNNTDATICVLYQDELYLKRKDGEIAEGNFTMYKNMYKTSSTSSAVEIFFFFQYSLEYLLS